ncbi:MULTISPECIES: ATP-binding protein [unclassified Bradyrhizobium]|uniref:ATP-binding protein n=1 Tax=unclassified Bradyrhizobium TaxID=2631580 RepID=UPI002915E6B2|nr:MULTISPECIES: winged helix-turn-helix domain-containing protein [unclassified Bradyrhizobium]
MTLFSEQSELLESPCLAPQRCGSLSGLFGAAPVSEECYEFASFRLYPKQRALLVGSERVEIGGRALDLLILLISRAGDVVSLGDLKRIVWPNITVEETNIRVQMGIVRKLLSQCDGAKRAIDTIPLRGYCFVLPVRHRPSVVELEGPRAQRHFVLPILPNLTVGRDDAIQTIEAILDKRRLVTITGPGGIGKTTVAIATAKRYAANFRGLISFVDLSHVTNSTGAARVIAEALQLASYNDALDAVCEHLRFREALLILDTCEHIVEPVATLVEAMLGQCNNLKLIVTSREALRATGEWTHRLPSLTFPAEKVVIEEKDVADFSALTLFVDRVQSSMRFEPHSQDLPTMAEICRRLDGIPLALEFAAARVADLGLRKIAGHLNNCFAILTRGRRTALPRHRTLAAAFDWSYGLLSREEQIVLSHLATLSGPFTAERAIASCLDGGCACPSETFYGLYDKSLLTVEMMNKGPMFRLLDTTRAYLMDIGHSSRCSDRDLPRSINALGRSSH